MADEAQTLTEFIRSSDSRARSGDVPLVHGTGALSSGTRLLQLRAMQDWARGDYFTNVSVGSLFGRLMARQFGEIWERLGRPDDFVIVEQGAHDGTFASDVLAATRYDMPEFFAALRYRIVEPFPVLRAAAESNARNVSTENRVAWNQSNSLSHSLASISQTS